MKPKNQVEYRPVNKLKELPGNPRTINKDQFEKLKASISANADYFEARPCILSDRTGELVVIAGNQRLKAAKALKMAEIPTVLLPNLTEEREKEIIIRDNVENGEWDMDILANEWDVGALGEWGVEGLENFTGEPEEIVEDEVPEPPEEPTTKLGEIWQLGEHRLMCGDSTSATDVNLLLGDNLADCLFTDPPYNVNVHNSQGMTIQNDNMDSGEFRTFLDMAFKNASDHLKLGGAFYIWHADSESVNFRESALENGLETRQCLIWVKNSFNFGRQDYKWQHEPCLYGWKNGAGHYFVEEYNHPTVIEDAVDLEKLSKAEMKKLLEEIYSDNIKKTVIHEDRPLKNDLHPTMKPLKMCAEMIRNSTKEGEIVLDLFGGSGSTLMVCEQIGRKCYMMEYDPLYMDVIIERWENFTGQKAIKLKEVENV